jgi:predicted secreted hydrolase
LALVEGLQKLNFPKDHYTHDTPVEWWYFWGKISNGDFFHYANFRVGIGKLQSRAVHWSIHNSESNYFEELPDIFDCLKYRSTYMAKGNLFSLQTKSFYLSMTPNYNPVVHHVLPHRNCYSIPSLSGEGQFYPDVEITSDVWMDHEFSEGRHFSNWDWVGVKLDCGLYIMAHDSSTDKSCSIMFGNKVLHSDFILDGKHLFLHPLSMYLILEPKVEEKIFDPKFGIKYSEQPFEVISKGGVIGYGMREKTYHGGNENA